MFKKTIMLAVIAVFLGCFVSTGLARADVNDFTVTNFEADYYLSKNDPHGQMDITEKIEVNFTDNNHGILRAIPKSYQGHSLQISSIETLKNDGTKWPYETYSSNGNLVLKIGDANKTVTGPNTFIVKYQVTGPISYYEGHDELYWDVNGDNWQQPFINVVSRLHIPIELTTALKPQQKCYAGSFGQTFENCFMARTTNQDGSVTITTTARELASSETLSFVVAFEKGTFAVYTYKDKVSELRKDIFFGIMALLLLSLSFINWWRNGKDYAGRQVLIAEYKPPKNIDPMRAGIIQDYNLDSRDITAAIIDLAVKGYLSIIEDSSKKFLVFSSKKYSLKLAKTDTSKLNEYEDRLIKALFSPFSVGQTIELGAYNSGLATETKKIGEDLTAKLTSEGYYEQNPKKASYKTAGVIVVGLIAVIVLGFMFNAPLGAGFAIAMLVLAVILLILMPRRSRLGQAAHSELRGLKYYLEVAENQRIEKLQSVGAKYAKQSKEPKKTVELFEKLLPFAIILGVEKSWAKQFEAICTSPPDWYSGNMSSFNSVVLTNHLMSSASAVGSTFAAPSSSSGSGFSGGGSGGGGGGGGGGGW